MPNNSGRPFGQKPPRVAMPFVGRRPRRWSIPVVKRAQATGRASQEHPGARQVGTGSRGRKSQRPVAISRLGARFACEARKQPPTATDRACLPLPRSLARSLLTFSVATSTLPRVATASKPGRLSAHHLRVLPGSPGGKGGRAASGRESLPPNARSDRANDRRIGGGGGGARPYLATISHPPGICRDARCAAPPSWTAAGCRERRTG
jgi:hypothetical protein